jgi:hypothetical protein
MPGDHPGHSRRAHGVDRRTPGRFKLATTPVRLAGSEYPSIGSALLLPTAGFMVHQRRKRSSLAFGRAPFHRIDGCRLRGLRVDFGSRAGRERLHPEQIESIRTNGQRESNSLVRPAPSERTTRGRKTRLKPRVEEERDRISPDRKYKVRHNCRSTYQNVILGIYGLVLRRV